jgi:NADH-quinone oxidoreductase subunit L
MIIEAAHHSKIPGAGFAYFCVLAGVAVTSFYTFRMLFLTFHGKERFDAHTREHLHESPKVVTVPLILLAIPSVIIGGLTIEALLFGDYFGGAIQVLSGHDVLAEPREHFHGALNFILHGFTGPVLYVAAAGVVAAWFIYLKQPELAERLKAGLSLPYRILDKKYGFDELYQRVFAGGGRALANRLWRTGDVLLIDGLIVNGAARVVGLCSRALRLVQTGYLFHYAFAMIVGLLVLLGWTVWR